MYMSALKFDRFYHGFAQIGSGRVQNDLFRWSGPLDPALQVELRIKAEVSVSKKGNINWYEVA